MSQTKSDFSADYQSGAITMTDLSVSFGGAKADEARTDGLHTDVDITDEYQQQDRTFSTASDNYPKHSLTGCDEGFENVQEVPWDDLSTTQALDLCKKYVLRPYNVFLKVIGWRAFRSEFATRQPIYKTIANIVYPSFIFIMLCITSISQVVSCLSRTRANPPIPYGEFKILDCSENVVTGTIASYFLILLSYVFALYVFRYAEPEHLSSLTETAFLSFTTAEKKRSRKVPVFVLLSFLFAGIVWVIFSFGVSLLRLFALQLHDPNTIIGWFTNNVTSPDQISALKISFTAYNILHYIFVSFSIIGFFFFDLFYVAVVINYCSQCQLLIYYINNIRDKVRNKKCGSLNEAAKELNKMSEFLVVLNSKVSYITSLILFIFIQNVIFSYIELSNETPGDDLSAVLGFMNIIQWSIAAAFPIIMATWLTSVARGIRKLGLEIAARPFVYSETPDLDLDIFLNFTSATNYRARLAQVPMYPSYVVGFIFVLGILLSAHVVIPRVRSVPWF